MSVKVTSNVPKVELDTSTSINLFLRFFMDDVQSNSDPLTPKDQGPLRDSILKTVSGNIASAKGTMRWTKEYAAAQEAGVTRGFPIRKYTTPGTGANYAQRGVAKSVLNSMQIMQKARLV